MKKLLILALVCGLTSSLIAIEFPSMFEDTKAPKTEKKEVAKKSKIPNFEKGNLLYGKKVTSADWQGKVVFFEYWGINCPPCRASFPHLQELQNKYGKTGKFLMVGSHVQGLEKEKIVEFLKSQKVTFPVYHQLYVPNAGPGRGIPSAVLIGHDGEVIAQGHPSELYSKVPAAIKAVPAVPSILTGVKLVKYKSMEKAFAVNAKNIEGKVNTLRGKTDPEAQAICAAYDAWANAQKTALTTTLSENPIRGIEMAKIYKSQIPSDTDFDLNISEFKQNKNLMKLNGFPKKIDALKAKFNDGKKISSDLTGIKRSLEKMSAETDSVVQITVKAFLKEVETLEANSAE